MTEQQFYIEGMTCSGCERTLENAVSRLEGSCTVHADRQNERLKVRYDVPCTEEMIVRAVEKAGYHVTKGPCLRSDGVYLIVILLGLYVIARQLGWTEFFRRFPTVSGEQMGYAALFLVGLLTSVHCIAMCGGLNLAQSMSGERHHPLFGSVLYNLGWLPKPVERGLSALRRHGAFAIGLANGLMPCGPLQSMQLYAVASGSFLTGAASMFFFCLGTIPLVLLFGTAAGALKMNWRRRMLQLGSALLVLMGLFTVQNNLTLAGILLPGTGSSGNMPVMAAVEGDRQYVTTTIRANGFDDIQVAAGIPVVWTIVADEESLNGCNNEIVIPAFGQQVELEAGTTTITFIPEHTGSYPYSCWMGMLRNTITVIDVNGNVK